MALSYGLDPILGELMLYAGKPYVTVAARVRKAGETGQLDHTSSRIPTREEVLARRYGPEDYCVIGQVWRKGSSGPTEMWGVVTVAEVERNKKNAEKHDRQSDSLPIVKDPMQHAEKRALARALRFAGFSLPVGLNDRSFEEVGAEDKQGYESVEPGVSVKQGDTKPPTQPQDTVHVDGKVVVPGTGEILRETTIDEDFAALRSATETEPPKNSDLLTWLKELMPKMKWDEPRLVKLIADRYKIDGKDLSEVVPKLDVQQAGDLTAGLRRQMQKAGVPE